MRLPKLHGSVCMFAIFAFNLTVPFRSENGIKLSQKKRNPQCFKREQDGHDEIGVFFKSFLERTAWVIYRKIVYLIEDSSINFSFHQELLFRTSDFHSKIHKLCHSRNVYDFKTNIPPIKHA